MRIITSLLLLLCSSPDAFSQTSEKLYDYAWRPTEDPGKANYLSVIEKKDSLWERTDYYLRQKTAQMTGTYQDESLKKAHGFFNYYHPNGRLESKGQYRNGKKYGVWVSYYETAMIKDSITYDEEGVIVGTTMSWHRNGYPMDSSVYNEDRSGVTVEWYDNGNPSSAGKYSAERKMHGKWKYYHKNGESSAVEIYEHGQLLSKQYFDEKGKEMSDTTSKDREASFPGGITGWQNHLVSELFFPPQYKLTGSDQIVVVVNCTIDEEGKVRDDYVSVPFHSEFDKIALNAVTKSPKWIPAISHNRKIKAYRRQSITFAQSR